MNTAKTYPRITYWSDEGASGWIVVSDAVEESAADRCSEPVQADGSAWTPDAYDAHWDRLPGAMIARGGAAVSRDTRSILDGIHGGTIACDDVDHLPELMQALVLWHGDSDLIDGEEVYDAEGNRGCRYSIHNLGAAIDWSESGGDWSEDDPDLVDGDHCPECGAALRWSRIQTSRPGVANFRTAECCGVGYRSEDRGGDWVRIVCDDETADA